MTSILSIIIPAYNEEDTLAEVIERIDRVSTEPYEKEIIICDDGSTDATADVIRRLVAQRSHLITYVAPVNMGKGAAVRVGMSKAKGDIVLIQDADLELDPQDYPQLLAPFSDPDIQVVYGSRFSGGQNDVPRTNRWANRFLTLLTNLLYSARLTDMETAYKVLRRQALADLRLSCVRFDFEPEITAQLLRAGYSVHEVPVSYAPRSPSEGKKTAWRDGLDAIYTLIRCRIFG